MLKHMVDQNNGVERFSWWFSVLGAGQVLAVFCRQHRISIRASFYEYAEEWNRPEWSGRRVSMSRLAKGCVSKYSEC